MSRFAVIRHPDVTVAGLCPEGAFEFQHARGWYRVSEWTETPGDYELDDFGPDLPDLDAPPPKKTRAKAKAEDETDEHDEDEENTV
jgi:hypothetical protein